MEEKELINRLKILKNIKPSDDWVILCRSRLAFRMEMRRKKNLLNKDFSVLRELFAFWDVNQPRLNWKLAQGALISFFVLAGLGGATVWAAKQSLPGTPLYPVKIVFEKARMMISLSQEERIRLSAEMTENRLSELQEVAKTSESASQKRGRVAQVVENLQEQMNQANSQSVKSQPAKAVAISKTTSDVGKALSQVKEILPEGIKQDLSKELAEVAEVADKAGIQALETILKSPNQANVEKDDILAKVDEKILNAQTLIKNLSQKADSVFGNVSTSDKFTSDSDKLTSDKIKMPIIRAVLVKDQSDKAQELLDQAKNQLNEAKEKIAKNEVPEALNDISKVLDSINLAKTIIKSAQTIVDSSTSDDTTAETPEIDGNSTSSIPAK